MKINVRVPMLSDSVASGTLLPWRKQVGDKVARDETLVDLETDKVILEIPSPASGTLIVITQPEGEVVKAEEVVAVIETGEGAVLSAPEVKPETSTQANARGGPQKTPSPSSQGAPSLRDISGSRCGSQVRIASSAWLPTGTMRVLRPLPVTCASPACRLTASRSSPTSSARRRPDE